MVNHNDFLGSFQQSSLATTASHFQDITLVFCDDPDDLEDDRQRDGRVLWSLVGKMGRKEAAFGPACCLHACTICNLSTTTIINNIIIVNICIILFIFNIIRCNPGNLFYWIGDGFPICPPHSDLGFCQERETQTERHRHCFHYHMFFALFIHGSDLKALFCRIFHLILC